MVAIETTQGQGVVGAAGQRRDRTVALDQLQGHGVGRQGNGLGVGALVDDYDRRRRRVQRIQCLLDGRKGVVTDRRGFVGGGLQIAVDQVSGRSPVVIDVDHHRCQGRQHHVVAAHATGVRDLETVAAALEDRALAQIRELAYDRSRGLVVDDDVRVVGGRYIFCVVEEQVQVGTGDVDRTVRDDRLIVAVHAVAGRIAPDFDIEIRTGFQRQGAVGLLVGAVAGGQVSIRLDRDRPADDPGPAQRRAAADGDRAASGARAAGVVHQ